MSAIKFPDEFKRVAVAQVEVRGYPLRELVEWFGVNTKSIFTSLKQFSRPAKVIQEVDAQADKICRLKRDLPRVTDLIRARRQSGRLLSLRIGHPEEGGRKLCQGVPPLTDVNIRCWAAGQVCLHCRESADLCGPWHGPDAAGSSRRLLCVAACPPFPTGALGSVPNGAAEASLG